MARFGELRYDCWMTTRDKQIRVADREFTIRTLSFKQAREVYAKIQNIILLYVDEKASSFGADMAAMMGGALSDADFDFIVERFGQSTSVKAKDPEGNEKTLFLKDAESRDAVFVGSFESVFEWLEECIVLNFAGVIKKLEAAKPQLEEAQARAAANAKSTN